MDSGHKTNGVPKTIKKEFQNVVMNPFKFTGKVNTNDKSNILKLLHTLIRSNPIRSIANQLFYMGMRSSSKTQSVPFYPTSNSIVLNKSTYDNSYLKNYGLLMKTSNKKIKFLNIPNNVVWSTDRMLFEMIQMGKFQQPTKKHHEIYSQKHLYK